MKKHLHLGLKLKLNLEAVKYLRIIPPNTLERVNGGSGNPHCSGTENVCTTPH